jgi:hypothetical protein
VDPRGATLVGKGKKGGTYYIDLYQEISTDYFAYLDKRRLRDSIRTTMIDGVPVPTLRPEPELAIVLFHNVFPERTFQLEHFYLLMYRLSEPDFDVDVFVEFVRNNNITSAIAANVAVIQELHQTCFGVVPSQLRQLTDRVGTDVNEVRRFLATGCSLPYLFSRQLFWRSFAGKLREWYSFRTALIQAAHLIDPRFLVDVIRSIRMRMGSESVYKAE